MTKLRRKNLMALVCFLFASIFPAAAQMTSEPPMKALPQQLSEVGIEQRLNQPIPLDLPFRDETGQTVQLRQYFNHDKPVILSLVYFECPMMCTQVLNSLSSALRALRFDVGKQFDVLTVSFDPREKPELAAGKKQAYLQRYRRPGAEGGWHFLTGDPESITALTNAAGFHYQWDQGSQQFAHATGILILTPHGRIAQYYYGAEYSPKDLRLGLVEASQNRIGTVADQVLLYCYHYDPRTGRYGAVITNIFRLAGVVTILMVAGFLMFMFRLESKRRQGYASPGHAATPEGRIE